MTVLVTGGTGFVGSEIVRQLQAARHRVRLLARDAHAPAVREIEARGSAVICEGDILRASSLPAGFAGVDAVIHLVGIISELGQQTYERVHIEGTRHVLAAAQKAGIKRFVQMSALGTRAGAVSRYHRSKWQAEELVKGSGLEWTIFRPSIIYGPNDGFVNLFAGMSRFSPVLPVMGSGESKFQPIPVREVARAFVGSLTDTTTIRQTFDLCGNETLTLNQILDAILEVIHRRRLKVHLPLGLARWQARFLEIFYPLLLRRPPPFNRDQLVMLQEDNVGNARPAIERFHLAPGTFREEIKSYLRP